MSAIVQVESPFQAGDAAQLAGNVAYARAALRDCLLRGEAPFASHLLYTQPGVLDDAAPVERRIGIERGLEFLRNADMCVVYTDRGISPGMREGIRAAERAGIPVEYRSLES